MGLLEKLKNTFFEEEYVEVEEKPKVVKEVRKEVPKEKEEKRVHINLEKPKILRSEKSEKSEKVVSVPKEEDVIVEVPKTVAAEIQEAPVKEPTLEEKTLKRETNFGYFDDTDFLDFPEEVYTEPPKPKRKITPEVSVEKTKLYDNPSYANTQGTTSTKEARPAFKPTPIISPIYGILDKNYTKEEALPKKEVKPSSYVSRKNADLDSVREKAFGSLAGDFGLTAAGDAETVSKENAPEDDFEVEDHLLYDMSDEDKTPSVDKVTLQDAEEYFQDLGLEYNIDYKDAKLEKATGRRVSRTPKLSEIEEEEVSVSEEKVDKHKEKSTSLEDNLFDLIDSMYEEKE